MSMNLSEARVIDPILTAYAQGYQHADRVGGLLFPTVPVTTSAGKVLEFGKESFMLYNARRAPGAATKRIEFGYEGKPYALVQDSLESKVPREYADEAKTVAAVDLGMRASTLVMNTLTLALEYEQAGIATNPGNFAASHKVTLAGTSRWSDPDATPLADLEEGRQTIRAACGVYPNVAVFGPRAYSALKAHPSVTARFRNTDIVTGAMLQALLEIDRIAEGRSVYADDTGSFRDVWGDIAVLAYAPPKASGFEQPSFGYTYTKQGHPFVERPFWDNNTKSFIYGLTYERAPVLTGMLAGYLINGIIGD